MAEAQALVRRTLHMLTHLPIGEVSDAETLAFLRKVHRWMPELLWGEPAPVTVKDWRCEDLIELCADVLALDYQRRLLLGELRRLERAKRHG